MSSLAIVERYIDAWNRHDAAAIVACFADGGTYSDPSAGTLSGSAIADYADTLFAAFPDLSFELIGMDTTSNNRVVMQWTMCGTNSGSFGGGPPTGRDIALPGVDIITTGAHGICSVEGYFDQRTFVDQLGLQVIVQPHAIGPFTFGRATRVHSGNTATPGAIGLTWIDICSEAEQQYVVESSRQIAVEMTRMQGFISWIGIVVGQRMYTLTAWENATDVAQLRKNDTHREAVKRAFGPQFAAASQTGVYSAHHLNPLWVRCPACDQLVDAIRSGGVCECGKALPAQPVYV